MKNKKYDRSDPNTVIIIDREYLEFDIKRKEEGLLNKKGKLDQKTYDALWQEIVNHTSGFLEGCYLDVLYNKCEDDN